MAEAKAGKFPTHVVSLALAKSTKGTYVFSNPEGVIRSQYIEKEAYPNGAPKAIKVTVEAAE